MNSIVEKVIKVSKEYPDKAALVYEGQTITYSELVNMTVKSAGAVSAKKIKKKSKIIVEADDPGIFFSTFFATQLTGCIMLPVEKDITLDQLQELVITYKPAAIVTKHTANIISNASTGRVNEMAVKETVLKDTAYPSSDAECAIISTTGTTGKPLRILHNNRSMLAAVDNYTNGVGLTPESVVYTTVPFHLAGTFRRILAILYQGATAVISHDSLTVSELMNVIDRYGVNMLCIVNANLTVLMEADEEQAAAIGSRLEAVESFAGRITSSSLVNYYKRYPQTVLYNVYGTTESGCILINNTIGNSADSCLGKPAINAEVFLMDENGERITEPGKYGYIAVRGPMNMVSYYKKKALTSKVMKDGILIVSDIAYFDEEGYYYFVSRVGDLLNVNGFMFSPGDIENAALEYQYVKDCACVGTDMPGAGQVPVLYVVAAEGFNKDSFMVFLGKILEPYKIPEAVRVVSKIPRTTTGKIVRNVLPMLHEIV